MNPARRASSPSREGGSILLAVFLLVLLIAILATAQLSTVQSSSRQSRWLNDRSKLRTMAESGVTQALYEISYRVGGGDGKIGTDLWVAADDVGRDGKAATSDEGEGDGIPTPGEPNVSPVPVGKSTDGIRLLTHAAASAWPNVERVISTVYNANALVTVEAYAKVEELSLPGTTAVFVEPGMALDLKGNSFRISGTDTNPDGTPGSAPEVYGIATAIGTPAGTNATRLRDQVTSSEYDQITGKGSDPSIGESGALDFATVFNAFKASPKTTVAPGTYSSVAWGDHQTNNYRITYANGDVHLSGTGKGAGVLLIDGNLTISGTFTFVGMVIVRGDLRVTGGGAAIHIYGSVLVGETMTAIDKGADVTVSGTADIFYSSAALTRVSQLSVRTTTLLYWNDVK